MQGRTRIQAYKKLAEIASKKDLEQLGRGWRDRFGPLPEAVENLLLMAEIKLAAAQRKIAALEVRESKVMMKRGGGFDPDRRAVSALDFDLAKIRIARTFRFDQSLLKNSRQRKILSELDALHLFKRLTFLLPLVLFLSLAPGLRAAEQDVLDAMAAVVNGM